MQIDSPCSFRCHQMPKMEVLHHFHGQIVLRDMPLHRFSIDLVRVYICEVSPMLIPPNGPTRHVQKSRVIDDTTIPQYTGPKDARLTIAKDVCRLGQY